MFTADFTVSGSGEELPLTTITLFDGSTYDAYQVYIEYTQSVVDDFSTTTSDASIEQWYVEGLGLVAEEYVDLDTGDTFFTRMLSGYSGVVAR